MELSWGQACEVAANFFCIFCDDRREIAKQQVYSAGSSRSQVSATTALGTTREVMPRGFAPFITSQPRRSGRRPTTVRCTSLRDNKRTDQAERNILGIGRAGVRSPPQRVVAVLKYADAELCGIDTGLLQRELARL